ncbi:MAG: hypothetical protein IIZ39_10600 [Blautia sp.]|nr:hypothetical protein [Blautia sp.]
MTLHEYRVSKGLTIREMCRITGKTISAMHNYECGIRAIPEDVYRMLSLKYGVPLEEMKRLIVQPVVKKHKKRTLNPATTARADTVQEAVQSEADVAARSVADVAARSVADVAARSVSDVVAQSVASGPAFFIQSQDGRGISVENVYEIVFNAAPMATNIYVKPEENRAYWTGDGITGSISLWP